MKWAERTGGSDRWQRLLPTDNACCRPKPAHASAVGMPRDTGDHCAGAWRRAGGGLEIFSEKLLVADVLVALTAETGQRAWSQRVRSSSCHSASFVAQVPPSQACC